MPDTVEVDFNALFDGIDADRICVGADPGIALSTGIVLLPLRRMTTGALTGDICVAEQKLNEEAVLTSMSIRVLKGGHFTPSADLSVATLSSADKKILSTLAERIAKQIYM